MTVRNEQRVSEEAREQSGELQELTGEELDLVTGAGPDLEPPHAPPVVANS